MAKKIYRVQLVQEILSEIFIQANTRKEAEEIASTKGSEEYGKEEVIDAKYGSQIVKRPQGRIIHTADGYIDADDNHVKL